MGNRDYDVIVVGAGPSGSSAAYGLAKAGRSVLLMDRSAFPRNKPCAGMFSRRGLGILDFSLPEEIIKCGITRLRLQYRGKTSEVTAASPFAYMVDRQEFDYFLLKQAESQGADIKDRCTFTGMRWVDGCIQVNTSSGSYSCLRLVGADGTFSKVRKMVFGSFRRCFLAYAIYADVPAFMCDADHRNTGEFNFDGPLFGYSWTFGKGDTISLGLAGSTMTFKPCYAGRHVRQLIGSSASEYFRGGLHAGFLPIGCTWRRRMRHNVYLVGDAGGFVDPFLGEGISFAIESGYLLADLIVSGNVRDYRKAVCERFRARLNGGLLLAMLVHVLPRPFKKGLLTKEALRTLQRTIEGTCSYYDLLKCLLRHML